jgi:hypothetical protein
MPEVSHGYQPYQEQTPSGSRASLTCYRDRGHVPSTPGPQVAGRSAGRLRQFRVVGASVVSGVAMPSPPDRLTLCGMHNARPDVYNDDHGGPLAKRGVRRG